MWLTFFFKLLHHLFFKLIENSKFNHLINILIIRRKKLNKILNSFFLSGLEVGKLCEHNLSSKNTQSCEGEEGG